MDLFLLLLGNCRSTETPELNRLREVHKIHFNFKPVYCKICQQKSNLQFILIKVSYDIYFSYNTSNIISFILKNHFLIQTDNIYNHHFYINVSLVYVGLGWVRLFQVGLSQVKLSISYVCSLQVVYINIIRKA